MYARVREGENMFKDKTIAQYNELLASKASVPGGGSALPMVGAFACSLVEMAANVTLNKYGQQYEYAGELTANLKILAMCKNRLYQLADEDSVAFTNILAAMRLPKDTADQQSEQKNQLQKQYHKSALVPIEVMQVVKRALDCADKIAPYLYAYVASDGTIGADLMRCVVKNSIENVVANTSLIEDEQLRVRLNKQAKGICESV